MRLKDRLLNLLKKLPFIVEGYAALIVIIGEIWWITRSKILFDYLLLIYDPRLIIYTFVAFIISITLMVIKVYTSRESVAAIIGNIILGVLVLRFMAHIF